MCQACGSADVVHATSLSRRRFLASMVTTAAAATLARSAVAAEVKEPPKPQNVISPDAALERLVKGNDRYVQGVTQRHDFKAEREALESGQNPYAGILSCADSRIAPEY